LTIVEAKAISLDKAKMKGTQQGLFNSRRYIDYLGFHRKPMIHKSESMPFNPLLKELRYSSLLRELRQSFSFIFNFFLRIAALFSFEGVAAQFFY